MQNTETNNNLSPTEAKMLSNQQLAKDNASAISNSEPLVAIRRPKFGSNKMILPALAAVALVALTALGLYSLTGEKTPGPGNRSADEQKLTTTDAGLVFQLPAPSGPTENPPSAPAMKSKSEAEPQSTSQQPADRRTPVNYKRIPVEPVEIVTEVEDDDKHSGRASKQRAKIEKQIEGFLRQIEKHNRGDRKHDKPARKNKKGENGKDD